jgi:hypothetical protein
MPGTMTCTLDRDERNMLGQLCGEPWVWNRRYDSDVGHRLEGRGFAQLSMLGQWCPTPAGRLMAALM